MDRGGVGGGGDEAEDRYAEIVAAALADLRPVVATLPGSPYQYVPVPSVVAALKGPFTRLIKEVATLQIAQVHSMGPQPRVQEENAEGVRLFGVVLVIEGVLPW